MAQFHISKDPPDKTSDTVRHITFFSNQLQITFVLALFYSRVILQIAPVVKKGYPTRRIILFTYILNNDMI